MSSHTRRTSTSSLRSVSSVTSTTGVRASTSLIAIFLGLALRVLLFFLLPASPKVTFTLIGLWEGPVLHHFLTESSENNWDPYVGFGVRMFVDFIVTEGDFRRLILVLMWTGTGLVVADIAPEVWSGTGAKRSWHRLRRQLYILGSRVRRWSPTRVWKSRAPPPPRRVTTIRFDDNPSRGGPSTSRSAAPSELTAATSMTRDNVSILSGSSYTNTNSESISTFTPPSILTGGSSIYSRSYAPSVLSNTNTGAPSSVVPRSQLDAPSEVTVTDDDSESITPPASPVRGRRKVPVPAFPGFFPDHFSETGTDYSALPPRSSAVSGEGTSHVTMGTLRSRKGKERAYEDEDLYTSSDITEDDPLTETDDTDTTPNAQNLQEIPDEAIPVSKRNRNKLGLDFDSSSAISKEDELEKQRLLDADIEPPPTAGLPVIPDEPRPQLDELDIFEKAFVDEPKGQEVNSAELDGDWTNIDKSELPPPLPPKDKEPEPDNAIAPEVQVQPESRPPSSPPRSLRHKKSMSSLHSFAPDVTVVPPSEIGETESLWGGRPPSEAISGSAIAEEPAFTQVQEEAPASTQEEAPAPPPREDFTDTRAAEISTPPPSFQEALASPMLENPEMEQAYASAEPVEPSQPQSQSDPSQLEPSQLEPSQTEPAQTEWQSDPVSTFADEIDISPSPPMSPIPSPPDSASGRLSWVVSLTEKQGRLLKDLHKLDRQRKAALEEGSMGVATAITRKAEMKKVQRKLEGIGEEVFLAHNPWAAGHKKPPANKPLDLSGTKPTAGIDKLEELLATLIRENAEQRRKSMATLNFDGELDASVGVDTLEKMSNKSLLIQVDKGVKGKQMKNKIQTMCKEQKLNFRDDPSNSRQFTIMLPSLDDDDDDE